MYVDDYGVVVLVESCCDFCELVGVGWMIGVCEYCFEVVIVCCVEYVLCVGCDEYLLCVCFVCVFGDMYDYWFVVEIGEWFVWELC